MTSLILTLAMMAQNASARSPHVFSYDKPAVGDTVCIFNLDPWTDRTVDLGTLRVRSGQLAKVVVKIPPPGRGSGQVILLLPDKNIGMAYDSEVNPVTNLPLAKRVFFELTAGAAEVEKKPVFPKMQVRLLLKSRLDVMKKHKLDDLAMSLIQLAGRANNW